MPASASPSVTLLATARTFSSYDLGVTVTPALEYTCSAYVPHGTSTAHVTTMSSGFARSARPVMPSGLPGGTAAIGQLAHVCLVGGREHVGWRALEELPGELGRRREVERCARTGFGLAERLAELGERVGERRRGE